MRGSFTWTEEGEDFRTSVFKGESEQRCIATDWDDVENGHTAVFHLISGPVCEQWTFEKSQKRNHRVLPFCEQDQKSSEKLFMTLIQTVGPLAVSLYQWCH